MKTFGKVAIFAVILTAALFAAPRDSFAHGHGRVRGSISIGIGGPFWYGGFYDPWFYGGGYPYYPGYGYGPGYYYPSDYGYLKTDISPKAAEVWVDGKRFGTADEFQGWFHSLKLPLGVHTAKFRLPGYQTYTVSFTITSDDTTTVKHELKPVTAGTEDEGETGVLIVTTRPPGSDIYVDGAYLTASGETGRVSIVLSAGRHELTIKKAGYRDFPAAAYIGAGREVEMTAELREGLNNPTPDGKPAEDRRPDNAPLEVK